MHLNYLGGIAMSDTNQTLPTGAAPGKHRSGHSAHGGGLFSTED